jgi:catechol 2,3-dioxygenase-like lactoylglutathione lyase family enzyme
MPLTSRCAVDAFVKVHYRQDYSRFAPRGSFALCYDSWPVPESPVKMKINMRLAFVLLVVVSLATTATALAQLASPNSNGIAIGHVHVNATDIEAQARFWTQLGGKVIQREKLTMVQFPGIYVILRKQDPTGGTIGTTMNHFGFYVKDFKASVARWQAAGLPWEPVTTNPAVGQGFMTGPDGVRVEIYENKTIGPPMQMHHIHLVVPDPPAAQAWYVQHFSAVAGKRLGGVEAVRTQFDTANVPGAEITLSKSNAPTVPTKGRAVDHIGFEVRDIDAAVATLQAAGIKADGPVRNSTNASGLRIVYVTDPWGTEIELTQGLAATPLAK